jgi:hypothetical protein
MAKGEAVRVSGLSHILEPQRSPVPRSAEIHKGYSKMRELTSEEIKSISGAGNGHPGHDGESTNGPGREGNASNGESNGGPGREGN